MIMMRAEDGLPLLLASFFLPCCGVECAWGLIKCVSSWLLWYGTARTGWVCSSWSSTMLFHGNIYTRRARVGGAGYVVLCALRERAQSEENATSQQAEYVY